jgi:lipopolysaccharide export system protein LptA
MVSESEPLSTSKKPSQQPSVIRMQGGNLKYSAAERKVVMYGGILGKVQVETADMESASNDVEVYLLPPGNHAGKNGSSAQVDKFVAHGSVTLTAQGRIGVGEQLAYGSDTGEYVLTGTSSQPPRLSDPVRGSVTGEILIFNSRDDSVKVESARGRTTTQSAAPRARLR